MSVNRITMSSAIETLGSMFPHLERKILKSYIFKTNGHMERTVELLLQHQLQGTVQIQSSSAPRPSAKKKSPPKKTGPLNESMFKHTLSDDFLRIVVKKKRKKTSSQANQRMVGNVPAVGGGGGFQQNQIRTDEELARRLQQEYYREAKRERRVYRQRNQQQTNPAVSRRPARTDPNRSHRHRQHRHPPNRPAANNPPRRRHPHPAVERGGGSGGSGDDDGFNWKKKFSGLSEWGKKRYIEFREKLKKKKRGDDMEQQSLTAPINELEDGDEIELVDRNIAEDGVLDL